MFVNTCMDERRNLGDRWLDWLAWANWRSCLVKRQQIGVTPEGKSNDDLPRRSLVQVMRNPPWSSQATLSSLCSARGFMGKVTVMSRFLSDQQAARAATFGLNADKVEVLLQRAGE